MNINTNTLNNLINLPFEENKVDLINIFNETQEENIFDLEMKENEMKNKQKEKELKKNENTTKDGNQNAPKKKKYKINYKALNTRIDIDSTLDFKEEIKAIEDISNFEKNLLALGDAFGNLIIVNLSMKKVVNKEKGHSHPIQVLIHLNKLDKKRTLISLSDMYFKIWDLKSMNIVKEIEVNSYVSCCAYLGNLSLTYFCSGHNSEIRIWDYQYLVKLDMLEEMSPIILKSFGHTGLITCFLHLVNYSTYYLLSGSEDKSIIMWDLSDLSIVNTYEGHIDTITSIASLLQKYFISSSQDRTLRVWHVNSGKSMYHILTSKEKISFVFNLEKIYNDNMIVIGDVNGKIQVINLNTNLSLQETYANLYLSKAVELQNSEYYFAILEGDFHLRFIKLK